MNLRWRRRCRSARWVVVSLDTLVTECVFGAPHNPAVAPYDPVVFDEAHKLSASRTEHRVTKTQRYELAEALAGVTTNHVDSDSGGSGDVRFAGLTWAAKHVLLLTATPMGLTRTFGKTAPRPASGARTSKTQCSVRSLPSPSKSCGGRPGFYKACVLAPLPSLTRGTSPSSRSSARFLMIPGMRRTNGRSSPSTGTPWISWCDASKVSATPTRSPSSTAAWRGRNATSRPTDFASRTVHAFSLLPTRQAKESTSSSVA